MAAAQNKTPRDLPPDEYWRGLVDAFKHLYAVDSPENPTRRGYLDWDGGHYLAVSNGGLAAIRLGILNQRPEISEIIPTSIRAGRTDAEARFLYLNIILREIGRRQELGVYYESPIADMTSIANNVVPAAVNMDIPVTVSRPQFTMEARGVTYGEPVAITGQPEDIYVLDLAMDTMRNATVGSASVSGLRPDLAAAVSRANGFNRLASFEVELDDVRIWDAGFTLGANPNYGNGGFTIDANISREVYSILPRLSTAIFNGQNVDDHQALVAGFVAGVISRRSPELVNDTTVYPPR